MKRSEMKVASDALFALLEGGPRNSTVSQVATFLRDGDEAAARRLYEWDGDKIATTIYQREVQKHLGCRLHGRHDCDSFLCRANSTIDPARQNGGAGVKACGKVEPHPDVMKAAQALVGVAWLKDHDRIPGAVDRVLDELKKHPTPNDQISGGITPAEANC